MVSPIKKSRNFNVFRIQPRACSQKPEQRITSRQFFVNFTDCLYISVFFFKILLLTYKTLNGLVSKYLSDLITLHHPNRRLRSNNNNSLRLYRPVFRTKNYGGRAFSSSAPALRNNLPLDVRCAPSVKALKTNLKLFCLNLMSDECI